jgi:hypothetical protein
MRILLPLALLVSLALLVPLAALAEDPGSEPYPLKLRAGKTIALCTTGTITCPAASPICDDTGIVDAFFTAEGLVLKGMKPGVTLCSAASDNGLGSRRIYRVTVTP